MKNYELENLLKLKELFGKDNPNIEACYHRGDCVKCGAHIVPMQETHENVFILADRGVFHICDKCLNLNNKHVDVLSTDNQTNLQTLMNGPDDVNAPKKPKPGAKP